MAHNPSDLAVVGGGLALCAWRLSRMGNMIKRFKRLYKNVYPTKKDGQ